VKKMNAIVKKFNTHRKENHENDSFVIRIVAVIWIVIEIATTSDGIEVVIIPPVGNFSTDYCLGV
jgi:threonine synthase